MRPMTSSANITTPRFVSAVGGRVVRAGLYTARAGNAGRLTADDADLLGRLLLIVRKVHGAIGAAVRGVRHLMSSARSGPGGAALSSLFCGLCWQLVQALASRCRAISNHAQRFLGLGQSCSYAREC